MCLGHLVVVPNPKVGERWYVKYKSLSAMGVTEVKIKSKSELTIELSEGTNWVMDVWDSGNRRYLISEIEFIERFKEAP